MAGNQKYVASIGQVFGNWKVVDIPPLYVGVPKALCKCVCGTEREVGIAHLLNGKSLSCGCVNRKPRREPKKQHGMSGTRIYKIWLEIRRLDKLKRKRVELHPEWQEFTSFFAWARASGYSNQHALVRTYETLGHSPINCYWERRIGRDVDWISVASKADIDFSVFGEDDYID